MLIISGSNHISVQSWTYLPLGTQENKQIPFILSPSKCDLLPSIQLVSYTGLPLILVNKIKVTEKRKASRASKTKP